MLGDAPPLAVVEPDHPVEATHHESTSAVEVHAKTVQLAIGIAQQLAPEVGGVQDPQAGASGQRYSQAFAVEREGQMKCNVAEPFASLDQSACGPVEQVDGMAGQTFDPGESAQRNAASVRR